MWAAIRNRLLQLAAVVFLVSVFTFGLMKLAPGDPVMGILNADELLVTEADKAKLTKELGFDQPLYIQYLRWMQRVVQLDLGKSYMSGKPVWQEMVDRLPITAQLTGGAILVTICLAFPLGVMSALFQNKWPDHAGRIFSIIGASIPGFWLGLLLIYFFSYKLQLFPSSGTGSVREMILPSVALGFSLSALYARLLRAGLIAAYSEEYVKAARARGIREGRIFVHHVLRAALLPVLTVFGMSLGSLLGGAVVIEMLFSWPGLGSMAVEAIFSRDYPVIQGYVLLTAVLIVVINLAVDLSYYLLDPRLKQEGEVRG